MTLKDLEKVQKTFKEAGKTTDMDACSELGIDGYVELRTPDTDSNKLLRS